jgi:antitoxin PrlF
LVIAVISMASCESDTCRIDAVITMDVKGQIVLPKDLREKANMKANDKIAVVACEKDGEVCCIMMVKAEKLVGAVTKTLGPLIKGLTNKES